MLTMRFIARAVLGNAAAVASHSRGYSKNAATAMNPVADEAHSIRARLMLPLL